MNRWIARLVPVFLTLATWLNPSTGFGAAPEPEEARLRAHVFKLASAEFLGRRGAGGVKAADYIVDHFKSLRLEPLFDGSFDQVIPGKDGSPPIGRNVGAILRGKDAELRDDWVIVSAHFDHLGRRGGVVYPGADDNASGVAMMLEVARSFVESSVKPKRSIMFIGFDLEEVGLFGSRYFVEHSPIPLKKISLFITADMIGRSLGGVCRSFVFVLGTEHTPGLRPWIEDSAKLRPVTVGLLGSDLLVLDRSDYGPFRSRKIPYLFFSTGENPTYHTPQDVAETLDYPKLTAISRIILGVSLKAANQADAIPWVAMTEYPVDEGKTIRDVLRTLLENREVLKIGPAQSSIMANTLRTLDAIIERGGPMSTDERTRVVRVVKVILFSLF